MSAPPPFVDAGPAVADAATLTGDREIRVYVLRVALDIDATGTVTRSTLDEHVELGNTGRA